MVDCRPDAQLKILSGDRRGKNGVYSRAVERNRALRAESVRENEGKKYLFDSARNSEADEGCDLPWSTEIESGNSFTNSVRISAAAIMMEKTVGRPVFVCSHLGN